MEALSIFKKLTPYARFISRGCKPILPISYKLLAVRQCSSDSGNKNGPISVYEPDYLDALKPKFPQYESLNVAIKGYDYPILENYQRYLHSIAEYLDIDVSDCYALPAQQSVVQRLRPNSAVVDAEYKLTMYERNLQMNNVDTPLYPIFVRIAQSALPEGVIFEIKEHTEESEERRYVPDRDLLELKAELERMTSGHGSSGSSNKKK